MGTSIPKGWNALKNYNLADDDPTNDLTPRRTTPVSLAKS